MSSFSHFKTFIHPKRPAQKPLNAVQKIAQGLIDDIAELFKDTNSERIFPAAVYRYLRERYGLEQLVDQVCGVICLPTNSH
jgi:hypothetical protein